MVATIFWHKISHIKSVFAMKTGCQLMKKKLQVAATIFVSFFSPENKLALNGHLPFTPGWPLKARSTVVTFCRSSLHVILVEYILSFMYYTDVLILN